MAKRSTKETRMAPSKREDERARAVEFLKEIAGKTMSEIEDILRFLNNHDQARLAEALKKSGEEITHLR